MARTRVFGLNGPQHYFRKTTLLASGWKSNSQTVSVPGILANEDSQLVISMPATSSMTEYIDSTVLCTGQGSGTLTFTCEDVPTHDLTIYLLVEVL